MASKMSNYVVRTSRGPVYFHAEERSPRVMLIHGFKRSPRHVAAWRQRIPGLGLISLPGHGDAPELDEVSIETWVAAWREALSNLGGPKLLIGESLGAIVAMCLPARAVVAVEPLLGVEHIWPQHQVMRNARARGMEIGAAYEALFDSSYDWVLDRISAPTLVIAGQTPLLPPRPLDVAPSLLTDEDFDRYAAHPLVEARRIPGGHTLLDENPDGVMELVAPFLAAHGG